MGCNNGKMVQVSPSEQPVNGELPSIKGKNKEMLISASTGSLRSENRPVGSATSKISKHSYDSGFDAQDVDDGIDEYAGIITENSDSTVIEEIEKNFQPMELDLCLNGMPAPRNLSAKDKARLDEQRILENLRNEGLIATSKFQAKSGLAFEVVEASTAPRRALPARLAKLDTKKKKKKTKEEIAEKLARAEQRRKEAEMEKLDKINAVTAKSDVHVVHVQEDQEKQKQELLENTIKKVDTVAEKREKMLQEKKDKQKAREEHAAKVRLRKKLHIPTQEELDAFNEQEAQAKSIANMEEPIKTVEDIETENVPQQTSTQIDESEPAALAQES